MPGTFFGLETARRGMQVHRTAMDTTAHNISNASTPGYTRQEAVISAAAPYTIPTAAARLLPGQLGTGAEANLIRRIRNEYLDVQVRDSIASRDYWQAQEELFARVEAVFPEPGAPGISDTMAKFFSTWHDLNNNPQDPGVKAAVVETGDQLATMLREAYRQLGNIDKSILVVNTGKTPPEVTGGQLQDQVNTVNDILSEIRTLTASIMDVYAQGNQPNDLLDRRDVLLDQLAQYGPVSVSHKTDGDGKPTGEIALTLFGVDVSDAGVTVQLKPTVDTGGAITQVKLEINDQSLSLADFTNGSLAGLEETRVRVLDYQDRLQTLAVTLRDTINQIKPLLIPDPDSNPEPDTDTTSDFFTGSLKVGDFAVNATLMSDPSKVDGTKALNVARLYSTGQTDLGGATFSEYFNGVLADIGARSAAAADMSTTQSAVNEQLDSLRQAAAGVNIDEELTRMMQFQYGYQASARVISTLDTMLDTLINRMAY